MSLYSEYVLEREGFHTIENEKGFATYKVCNDECYLRDIYVRPEHRKSHVGIDLCNQVETIAKEAGCKYVTGTVIAQSKTSTESMLAVIKAGFRIHSSNHEKIVLVKEI